MAYMTTDDVAKILNISVQSLRLYIRKGYIRCGSYPSGELPILAQAGRGSEGLF